MHDSWMPWGHGGYGGMWIGPLLWIGIIAVAIWAVLVLMRGGDGYRPLGPRPDKTPREILDDRFAKGEIDEEEYRRRREVLDR